MGNGSTFFHPIKIRKTEFFSKKLLVFPDYPCIVFTFTFTFSLPSSLLSVHLLHGWHRELIAQAKRNEGYLYDHSKYLDLDQTRPYEEDYYHPRRILVSYTIFVFLSLSEQNGVCGCTQPKFPPPTLPFLSPISALQYLEVFFNKTLFPSLSLPPLKTLVFPASSNASDHQSPLDGTLLKTYLYLSLPGLAHICNIRDNIVFFTFLLPA